jgi:hypothetical protein
MRCGEIQHDQSLTPLDGIQSALQHLKQERRFFRLQYPKSATTTDTVVLDRQLEQHQHQILCESAQRNELGLYRNASLVLGCLCIAREQYDAALDHMLDVAFLDITGVSNALPGYKSFDNRLSLAVPFVSGIIRDMVRTLSRDTA